MNNETKNLIINKIIGIFLILLGLILFILFSIWIILAKLIDIDYLIKNIEEDATNLCLNILNLMKNDEIICVFIPIFFPVFLIYCYCKWIAFNYFKYCD